MSKAEWARATERRTALEPASIAAMWIGSGIGNATASGETRLRRECTSPSEWPADPRSAGEASVPAVNKLLRQRIAEQQGSRSTKYTPSSALSHLRRQQCRVL